MTALGFDIDLRTDYLEEHWDDEAKCQSSHSSHSFRDGSPSTCTVEVVARKTTLCNKRDFLICRASYEINVSTMMRSVPCNACGDLSAVCWSVIPV